MSDVLNQLDSVKDYVAQARIELQDTVEPYRYEDEQIVAALNLTLMEARRIRSDLFIYKGSDSVPVYLKNDSTKVRMELPFRLAILYGVMGYVITRDQEDVQDARATGFMATFANMLTGGGQRVAVGGAPPGGSKQ